MVTSKRTKELPMTVPEVLKGAFHSVKIPGNFGSAVNGKRFVGSSHWKIPGESINSKKVDPLSRLERFERNFVPGGGGTPIHYLYGYVPPKGVVILKLLI